MLAAYNRWANRRLYAEAAALPDALYRQPAGAFFGSLHGTLNHLLVADRIWLKRMEGRGEAPDRLDAILHDDLPALRAAREAEDARLIAHVASLGPAELEAEFSYATTKGTPHRQRRWQALAHLFNHQTHHRGQAHAILTRLGVAEPASLDLLAMQRAATA
nr:DinB family protein [Siccirubricoccus soli]